MSALDLSYIDRVADHPQWGGYFTSDGKLSPVDAFAILLSSNIGLVRMCAQRMIGRGLDFDDLVSEGNIGLMKGLRRFDTESNYKISTYVVYWIKQAIGRAVADQGRIMRLPVYMHEQMNRFRKLLGGGLDFESVLASEEDCLTLGLLSEFDADGYYSAKTPDYLRKRLYRKAELKWRKMMKLLSDPLSLDDVGYGESDGQTLYEFIPDEDGSGQEDVLNELSNERLRSICEASLTEKEISILDLRSQGRTLDEVGKIFGITRERVRQILTRDIKRKLSRNTEFVELARSMGMSI